MTGFCDDRKFESGHLEPVTQTLHSSPRRRLLLAEHVELL